MKTNLTEESKVCEKVLLKILKSMVQKNIISKINL